MELVKHIPQERMQNGTEEQILEVPVPQCRNETGEVIQIFPQDRISDRIVDQIVGGPPVQQIREQICEVIKLIPHKRVQSSAVEQSVDVSDPRIQVETLEVIQSTPQDEQTVDVPGPPILEEIGGRIQLILQEQMSNHVVEPIVNMPCTQLQERAVEVVKAIPKESRVQRQIVVDHVRVPDFLDRVDDVPVSKQRQTPMTREVSKTVNSPRVQLIDKVVSIPVMHRDRSHRL